MKLCNKIAGNFSKPVDIAPIIFFRIAFGAVLVAEAVSNFVGDWIGKAILKPDFLFPYYGFGWVSPLPGWGMYAANGLLLLAATGMVAGWRYRACCLLAATIYAYLFLLAKSYYLNHAYLIILVGFWMVWLPANRAFSLDVRQGRAQCTKRARGWHLFVLRFHMGIVYFFGGIAKLNHDWLFRAQPLQLWLKGKQDVFLIGQVAAEPWFAYFLAWGGAIFDLSIIFLLLSARLRLFGFCLAVFFHATNKLLFGIGVFPAMSLALSVLFFPPETFRKAGLALQRLLHRLTHKIGVCKIGLPQTPAACHTSTCNAPPSMPVRQTRFVTLVLCLYVSVQLFLPLRHHLYPGNVNWTEEGHRFAWRMMLRSKSATASFRLSDPNTGEVWTVRPRDFLTSRQQSKMRTHPYMIWQFAQHLKAFYEKQGHECVEVYARCHASLNGRKRQLFIQPEVDLGSQTYGLFEHAGWIAPLEPAE